MIEFESDGVVPFPGQVLQALPFYPLPNEPIRIAPDASSPACHIFGFLLSNTEIMKRSDLLKICYALSALLILGGVAGMVLSFIFLASGGMADVHAGNSGFLAGAVMIGSGVISFSIVTVRSDRKPPE